MSSPAAPARRRRSTCARFAQATGQIKQDGVSWAASSARRSYSNNLDKVETIRPDGEIEDADPGMATGDRQHHVRSKTPA
jgi:hypothetical protein